MRAVLPVLGVAWLVSAVAWLLYVLQATIRGWWVQDCRDRAYTAHRFDTQLKGGEPDEACLGLVSRGGSLAGGQGFTGSPCRYCGEVDGHTGQCPVVSFGVIA